MRNLFLSISFIISSFVSIYSQNIPAPNEVLGYAIGTQFSRHHQVIDYFKAVEKAAPKQVKLAQYGTTNERRSLYLAYISSEENLKNIEQIRTNNLKNIGLNTEKGKTKTNNIAIVWFSYNVHGNEASSSEAAMQTLYELLTTQKHLLKNTIVIIDPCANPDGRDRYVNWYNQKANKPHNTNPEASEHNEPWPGGRPNHYLFDLNRDWAWATQKETQARLKMYNQWMPHIHVDFHEQGINEPYYFAPAAEPFHEVITDWQRNFQTEIGKNHAKYFDNNGWLFFTKERFDLLYPSYGDTYPTFMGAIGMTYEQAGHGMAGLGIINDEGHELTLLERLTHHTTTGISTIEMASKHAKKLNVEFGKFFKNTDLEYKSYVLEGNADQLALLTKLLNQHQIIYEKPTINKVFGYNYNTKKQEQLFIDNGLVVHTNQPKGKMVKALFEPNTKLTDSLTYDITAWSLPYAYGLKAVASKMKVPSKVYDLEENIETINQAYGYVCPWNSLEDTKFLAALLQQNIRVRFTEKPFTANGNNFRRGSLIITQRDNKHIANFTSVLNKIAQAHKRQLATITSGFSEATPDIGSPDVKLINKQNIAVLSGKGTSSLNYGEIWHFFEQELQYPLTSINTSNLSSVNLSKYHVLIIPSGYYGSIFNETIFKKLKKYVQQGGKIIAIDAALRSFAGKDGFALKYKPKDETTTKNNLIPYAESERNYTNQLITGAIFKTKIDNTHPMAFGYAKDYFTLKLGSSAYAYLDSGFNVGYLEDAKVFSGFAGKDALKNLNQTLVFGEERMGSGSFIYFTDNVLFRSFWQNGKLFFVNSLFFVNHNAFEL